ncbi:MAG: pantetheine-phosphate adenylyltransferase [Oscillospiraceae bacterium]|nr:pantetheine-phosphate adenylyltransferase [Oscillospiraceae bacterium]
MAKKAIYAGSFDCYTNGHHDIVKKASRLFDELHIVVSVNSQKSRRFPAEAMVEAIRESLALDGIENCVVAICSGITADYCLAHDIGYFVRGLRNSLDYNYEENIASGNKLIAPELETLYFRSDNAGISSSIAVEMALYGRDFSGLVPEPVYRMVKKMLAERQA